MSKILGKTFRFPDVKDEELILSCDTTQLRNHYIQGTFTISDVVTVYTKRTYSIGRSLNLVTEENYEEALK